MAIARLNSNLKTITFSTTISIQENLELKDGTIRSIYKSKHEHLGRFQYPRCRASHNELPDPRVTVSPHHDKLTARIGGMLTNHWHHLSLQQHCFNPDARTFQDLFCLCKLR